MLGEILQMFREGKFQEMDEKLAELAHKEEESAATGAAPVSTPEPMSEIPFEAGRDYRIHFKNGCSGEYAGAVLACRFPFDPEQVEGVERIEMPEAVS